MDNHFYRLCYTRVGGNSSQSGWQLVNVEEGTPSSLQGFFENTEKTNEVIGDQPKNPDGSPARMFEIVGGDTDPGAGVGMVYVQYGLSDAWGRAHFFSSGFMAQGAYDLLKQPYRLLGISESNFRFSEEETAGAPGPLAYDPETTEQDVFSRYSVSEEQYLTLIKCVYFMLFNSARSTLYVKTDGGNKMIRDLLFLIYNALPYSLRPRVSAATIRTQSTGKMLLFTDQIPEYGYWLDFGTGKNNVLTPDFEERLSRYSFAMFYPSKVRAEWRDKYYASLESVLSDLGNINEQDMLSLQLVHQTVTTDRATSDDLIGMLYDWLRMSETVGTKADRYIHKIMEEVLKKNVKLSRDNVRMLGQYVQNGASEEVRKQYVKYTAGDLLGLSREEAFQRMGQLEQIPQQFEEIKNELARGGDGLNLIRSYYTRAADSLLSSSPCGYDDLLRFWYNCDQRADLDNIRQKFVKRSVDLVRADIQSLKPFAESYARMEKTVSVIDPNRTVEISKTVLFDDFDASFRSNFSEAKIGEYTNFYKNANNRARYPLSAGLIDMLNALKQHAYRPVTEYLRSGCAYGNARPSEPERNKFVRTLFGYALSQNAAESCTDMEFWDEFALSLGEELVPLMAENRVALLLNSDLLQRSVDEDLEFWDYERLKEFYNKCCDYDEAYPDSHIISKKTGDILYAAIKAVQKDMKQAEKEQKQAEKAQRQAEKAQRQAESKSAPAKPSAKPSEKTENPADPDQKKAGTEVMRKLFTSIFGKKQDADPQKGSGSQTPSGTANPDPNPKKKQKK